ncbi:hypothetical protein N0V90_000589 [Kalmusia sp. IMI 367209]|nr:hypothetical protein N0V90_000589 [Kalmusia sp. IMI 367209]
MSAKLFTFTTLLALTAALPSGPRNTIERRGATIRTDCWQTNPGTSFYRCANGYIGCFAHDPCDLPSISDPTSPPAPSPSITTPETPQQHEITEPRSFNIYPKQVNVEDPVGHVDLKKTADEGIITTNALVFDNVPANAKNCNLKWRTDKANDRSTFFADGFGQVFSRQLFGFPSGKVTYNSLEEFRDNEAEFVSSMDFTGWESSPTTHGGPSLKCAEQVAVELKPSGQGDGDNRVFITLTKTNGFYLTYAL